MAVWRKLIITFGKMYGCRAARPIGNDVAMEKEMLGGSIVSRSDPMQVGAWRTYIVRALKLFLMSRNMMAVMSIVTFEVGATLLT